jgi:hypothetical protein
VRAAIASGLRSPLNLSTATVSGATVTRRTSSSLGVGSVSIVGRHEKPDQPAVLTRAGLDYRRGHSDLPTAPRRPLGDGRRHRYLLIAAVAAEDVTRQPPESDIARAVFVVTDRGLGGDPRTVAAYLHGVGDLRRLYRGSSVPTRAPTTARSDSITSSPSLTGPIVGNCLPQ